MVLYKAETDAGAAGRIVPTIAYLYYFGAGHQA